MQVTLKRPDLICLIRGICPARAFIAGLQRAGLGTYSGSYDRWDWAGADYSVWRTYTDEQLWGLYTDTGKL